MSHLSKPSGKITVSLKLDSYTFQVLLRSAKKDDLTVPALASNILDSVAHSIPDKEFDCMEYFIHSEFYVTGKRYHFFTNAQLVKHYRDFAEKEGMPTGTDMQLVHKIRRVVKQTKALDFRRDGSARGVMGLCRKKKR